VNLRIVLKLQILQKYTIIKIKRKNREIIIINQELKRAKILT